MNNFVKYTNMNENERKISINKKNPIVICECKNVIKESEIEFYNGVDELGEDYAVASFTCKNCNEEITVTQWSHFENDTEPIELISKRMFDHLEWLEKNKNSKP